MARIPGWTGAGPFERLTTVVAVAGAPIVFLVIYGLSDWQAKLFIVAAYALVGLCLALAAGREMRAASKKDTNRGTKSHRRRGL